MKFILSIHPVFQLTAILLGCYAGYLGIQRTRSLHFGQAVRFQRNRHVLVGAVSLLTMLGGLVGGYIMASRFLQQHDHEVMGLHENMALILLPLMVIGIVSGFFLYLKPAKRTVLPAVHALNNFILLILTVAQIYTGLNIYLTHVLQ